MNRASATTSIVSHGLQALAALLGTLGILAFAGTAAAGAADGKTTFETNCSSCHGISGKGDGPISAALNPKPRDFSTGEFKLDADGSGSPGDGGDLKLVIKNGALPYGGSALMAGWPTFSDEQVSELIGYIRSLKE